MKTVIFCGGAGSRMGVMTNDTPKPLIQIGNKSVLEHIMKHYSIYGVNEFIICLGYLGDKIKDYFLKNKSPFKLHLVDTGTDALKSQRLLAVKDLLKDDEDFFVAYGDDISNIDIKKLYEFHKKEKKVATLSAVRINNPYGVLKFNEYEPSLIFNFVEKPMMTDWINGGYFVFNRKIFDYLQQGGDLEKEVFSRLVKDKELVAFRHPGFWKSMNNPKDYIEMTEMFIKGLLYIPQ